MNLIQKVLSFKNIIFDLGGVIIDLEVERTVLAFAELAGKSPSQIRENYHQQPEFIEFEMGNITEQQFRLAVNKIFGLQAADSEIDRCWNAMLVDLPKAKLELLIQLKEQFRVSLLSNTNSIHIEYVNKKMIPVVYPITSLDYFFHYTHYSHLMRKRKPGAEIFKQLLAENEFDPKQTIFLDDNSDNIKTADSLGIQTKLVEHPDQVFQFFNHL